MNKTCQIHGRILRIPFFELNSRKAQVRLRLAQTLRFYLHFPGVLELQ